VIAPFEALWNDDDGQDLVEYALLVALIALLVIAALRVIGPTIANIFNNVESELATAT
jgi:pilus assembly protein Flp/PilA